MKKRVIMRRFFVLVLCLIAFALATAPNIAHAAAGKVKEFPLPPNTKLPRFIASGPDGNLWFTQPDTNKIGRITPEGVITEFSIPTPSSNPAGITYGPDGNVWFTEFTANQIGRISTH